MQLAAFDPGFEWLHRKPGTVGLSSWQCPARKVREPNPFQMNSPFRTSLPGCAVRPAPVVLPIRVFQRSSCRACLRALSIALS